jgi:hypothetical protein
VRRARPLLRRLARTERPARVRMRRRKPCFLCRRRLLGWYVRFMLKSFRGLLCESAWNWPPSTTGGCTAGSRQGPDPTSIRHARSADTDRSASYTVRHLHRRRHAGAARIPPANLWTIGCNAGAIRLASTPRRTAAGIRTDVHNDFPQLLSTCGELVSTRQGA